MLRFILTRVSLVIPTFIGMTLLAFFLIRLVPGDPIETMAGERGIDPARHAQLLKDFGLDKPIMVQYGIYIGRVLQGDLGKSIITQETVVREYIKKEPLASVNLLGVELKLGSSVPDTVELREVPNVRYRVAVINDQTVLVDPDTHQIVEVLN